MENEDRILTGKDLNQAKERITDDEVAKILKTAQKQLEQGRGEKISPQHTGKTDKAQPVKKEEDKKKSRQAKEAEDRRKKEEAAALALEIKEKKIARERIEKERIAKEKVEKKEKQQEKEKPFRLEDDVFIDKSLKPVVYQKDKVTVGRVIATILEIIWTCFKWTVVIGIVTAVAGFLLSRDMMIRGRNGVRKSTLGMPVSGAVAENKSREDALVEKWLKTVKPEKLTLEADDHSILVARRMITKKGNDKWAVILHGYNGDMEDVYDIAMHYTKEGYNILTPDLRASGESEGSFLGMGWLDRLDIINWIDIILEENPSAEIVIHGVDMGADTALMMSGEPLKSSVKAIVAEGAYSTAWEVMKKEYEMRHEKLPVFPFLHMMNPVMKVWAGYTLKEADAVKQVGKAAVPVLLIHGKNDTYATEEMTGELEQAIASPHEVLTIQTGTHEDCRYAEPDAYYDNTFRFIEGYVD